MGRWEVSIKRKVAERRLLLLLVRWRANSTVGTRFPMPGVAMKITCDFSIGVRRRWLVGMPAYGCAALL